MAKAPKRKRARPVAAVADTRGGDLARRLETAMADAITRALADGVTDPDEQRARMMKARQAVLDEGR